MKNPLRKRILRELRDELGKYLVIFLLLTATIGFVSGFLVADGSMLAAYEEGFSFYNIEDGYFDLAQKANKAQVKTIQGWGVQLYENFYVEKPLTNGSTLRVFAPREQVDRVCLMSGSLPQTADEVAIDRMYADNNGLAPGDTLETEDGRRWTVSGLVALSDYSCLFSDNNDSMFDSVKFGVGIVTKDCFDALGTDQLTYHYAWKYDDPPADKADQQDRGEELMKQLTAEVKLESFVPQYQNQAITFTGDDMGSDRAMMIALLYIIIAIMAFVFGVTTANTIAKEANVIGTLRASGYTRSELVRHYLAAPLLVLIVSAVVGNVLGYTLMKDVCAGMYYGSYSLPTYVTRWNSEAFLLTTVVPALLMLVINWAVLRRTLTLSPLKFLRRDLSRKKQRRAIPLSSKLPFFGRFRLRVIAQNLGSYAVLLVGVLFANLLLMFGMMFPPVLSHYQEIMEQNLLCRYQYLLQVPLSAANEEQKLQSMVSMLWFQHQVETEQEDAEKFSAYTLNTLGERYKSETVLLYGVEEGSRYIPIDTDGVWVSQAYADKYGVAAGDTLILQEPYGTDTYTFTIDGVYDYMGSLALFMGRDRLNDTFDLGKNYFCGYLSDQPITDIDEQYIASVTTLDTLTKISRQLQVSMGSMMNLVNGFAVAIFVVLVYLLSKIVIEKNAQSISMAKILGYSDGEIARLYLLPTSLVVVACLLISLPVESRVMEWLFYTIMLESISGWIPLYAEPSLYVKMLAIGLVSYAAVAMLELRRIRRVPMDEALKNVE